MKGYQDYAVRTVDRHGNKETIRFEGKWVIKDYFDDDSGESISVAIQSNEKIIVFIKQYISNEKIVYYVVHDDVCEMEEYIRHLGYHNPEPYPKEIIDAVAREMALVQISS